MSLKLKGIAAAPGIAIAPVVHFHADLDHIPSRVIGKEEVASEVERLEQAMTATSKSILFLRHEMARTLSDHDTKIYDVQVNLLHDQTFKADLVGTVTKDLVNVEVALQRVIARYEAVFEKAEDAAMRERAADIRDVGRQLLTALLDRERTVFTADGKDYIFAADEFMPSDAGVLDRDHLRGIVTARGGKYSHGAILARSLGIPCVVGVDEVLAKATSRTVAILDGESGQLLVDPDREQIKHYQHLIKDGEEVDKRVFEVRFAPSVSSDGVEFTLMVNLESIHDIQHVEIDSVSGVGLFRTEFAFMERRQFPAEDEQVEMYKAAMDAAKGRPVTFRTLDIGGDKPLPYFRTPEERNPVLGWRGLRISLSWPDILYTQVRAILRASATGHARILLPMVTNLEEVISCRKVLDQILADMRESGVPHDEDIEMGVMIEVPGIAQILDQVLPHVDFVSVGTNDLVQYLLAVDRDNPRVASIYDPYHPAVLRVLKRIAEDAERFQTPVSICGEIAGDHYYSPLLIGLGFRELSMSPVFLPRVKIMLRNLSTKECKALVEKALTMSSSAEIRDLARSRSREIWEGFLEEGRHEEG